MTAHPAQPLSPETPSFAALFRRLMRRDVLMICFVIFIADILSGVLSPTFSLYAQSLGASFSMIGTLNSITGFTQLITSMPIGALSDRYGRKLVLLIGMGAFVVGLALLALATNVAYLFVGRFVLGIAFVGMFTMGVAYVSDIVTTEERGLALGLYTTAMGVGFALGPLLGAAIAERTSVAFSYGVTALIAVFGLGTIIWGLRDVRPSARGIATRPLRFSSSGLQHLLRNPRLLGGCLSNLLMSTVFGGAMSSFFPLYAKQHTATQALINSLFATRAIGSTFARFPSGAITARIPSRVVMSSALLLAMFATLMMSQTENLWWLGVLLVIEGIGFGIFLPAGQAFSAEQSTPTTRGQVMGFYSSAGSLGNMLSPFVLGWVAELWGVRAVFIFTAALVAIGLCLSTLLYTRSTDNH